MSKIKVSKEVAHALEVALKTCSKAKFFEQHSNKMQWSLEVYLPLNQISNWEMAQILINGYEVEQTPKEKLSSYYNGLSAEQYEHSLINEGIEIALNTLGIKIKGIND